MTHVTTQAIILKRTDFEEAARIITLLTPDHGKLKAMARGVRKTKSKLAGGIELFSVSDVSYIVGRGEICTLTSTRLVKYYANIVTQLERANAGYDAIKIINKSTEDHPEPAYFNLLRDTFVALDNLQIPPELTGLWFRAQLLKLAGHTPNLNTDDKGEKLQAGTKYDFDFDAMGFQANGNHSYSFNSDHIKFLRLLFSHHQPVALQKVQGTDKLIAAAQPLIQSMLQTYVRI